jgi:hypothetical protein
MNYSKLDVAEVLLADGWHRVDHGTFHQSSVLFEFTETHLEQYKIVGPVSSILAVRVHSV